MNVIDLKEKAIKILKSELEKSEKLVLGNVVVRQLGDHPDQGIDCFDRVCARSRTKSAEELLFYFLHFNKIGKTITDAPNQWGVTKEEWGYLTSEFLRNI